MEFLTAAMSSLISIVAFILLMAGVMKAFQIVTLLGEIKDVLHDVRRGVEAQPTAAAAAPAPVAAGYTVRSQPQSAEALVQAVNSGGYEEVLRPEILPAERQA